MSKMYIEIININIIKIHYKRQNKLNIFSEWGGEVETYYNHNVFIANWIRFYTTHQTVI